MEESKRGFLPMRHGISLSKEMCPSTPQERERMSQIPYASAIGSIMYVMICTRPDLSYPLSMTSRYQANPGESHWTAVKKILKYLRRTKDVFLVYGGEEELRIKAKEAVWIKKFITGLGVIPSISDAVDLYCDNNGAIAQAKEPKSHQRSKHILRCLHLIREIIDRGDVEICKVHTDDNVADPLTKPLAHQKHDRHTESLSIRYFSNRKGNNMSLKNMFQMNRVLMLLELTKTKFKKHMDDMVDVGCLMLATMTPELQKQHEDMVAYEMI
ncbi:hypothetical protein V6N13_059390 [Hibiscus sabdariffa]